MHHVVENININFKASPFHRFLNNLEAAAAGPPCGWENIKLGKGWISRLGQFSAGCSPRAVDARAPWAALCIKCHLAWNHSPPHPTPGWYQPCHSHTARACMPGVRGEDFERCEHAPRRDDQGPGGKIDQEGNDFSKNGTIRELQYKEVDKKING